MPEGTRRRRTGTARQHSQKMSAARRRGPVYSAENAGKYLDVSRYTIYRLVENGELRAMKVNGRLRIAEADLDDYLDRAAS